MIQAVWQMMDLLVPADDRALLLEGKITLEEKIDGANVGISLDPESRQGDEHPVFRFQRRSHYVTTSSEDQFRGLDVWVQKYAVALRRLLLIPFSGGKRAKAGKRILFGEWLAGVCVCLRPCADVLVMSITHVGMRMSGMLQARALTALQTLAATHSKAHNTLPDRFTVFDVFDAEMRNGRGGFLSIKHRNKLLEHINSTPAGAPDARIWRVRAVGRERSFRSVDEILDVLNSEACKSAYLFGASEARDSDCAERVEGVYPRVNDSSTGLLRARAKLIHPDFHQKLKQGCWQGT